MTSISGALRGHSLPRPAGQGRSLANGTNDGGAELRSIGSCDAPSEGVVDPSPVGPDIQAQIEVEGKGLGYEQKGRSVPPLDAV